MTSMEMSFYTKVLARKIEPGMCQCYHKLIRIRVVINRVYSLIRRPAKILPGIEKQKGKTKKRK